MKVSKKGRQLIKHFEGFSATAYKCSAGDIIDMKTANKAFRKHLARQVIPVIKKLVKVPLKQNEIDALASFIYNVGASAFQQSTLLRMLNNNSWGTELEFSKWIYAGGKISEGLKRRRASEKHLFVTGGLEFYE